MNRLEIEPGRVVLSKAGRDAGRRMLVLSVQDEYAYVVDGDLRKVETPKKKKMKHIKATVALFPTISAMIEEGKRPSDAEIRNILMTDRQGRI